MSRDKGGGGAEFPGTLHCMLPRSRTNASHSQPDVSRPPTTIRHSWNSAAACCSRDDGEVPLASAGWMLSAPASQQSEHEAHRRSHAAAACPTVTHINSLEKFSAVRPPKRRNRFVPTHVAESPDRPEGRAPLTISGHLPTPKWQHLSQRRPATIRLMMASGEGTGGGRYRHHSPMPVSERGYLEEHRRHEWGAFLILSTKKQNSRAL